jgi:hypothetical protein
VQIAESILLFNRYQDWLRVPRSFSLNLYSRDRWVRQKAEIIVGKAVKIGSFWMIVRELHKEDGLDVTFPPNMIIKFSKNMAGFRPFRTSLEVRCSFVFHPLFTLVFVRFGGCTRIPAGM